MVTRWHGRRVASCVFGVPVVLPPRSFLFDNGHRPVFDHLTLQKLSTLHIEWNIIALREVNTGHQTRFVNEETLQDEWIIDQQMHEAATARVRRIDIGPVVAQQSQNDVQFSLLRVALIMQSVEHKVVGGYIGFDGVLVQGVDHQVTGYIEFDGGENRTGHHWCALPLRVNIIVSPRRRHAPSLHGRLNLELYFESLSPHPFAITAVQMKVCFLAILAAIPHLMARAAANGVGSNIEHALGVVAPGDSMWDKTHWVGRE